MSQSAIQSQSATALAGKLCIPGDKSISHRALMLAAIAKGDSEIKRFLESDDCIATANALRDLGVAIEPLGPQRLMVHGEGMHSLKPAAGVLDMGNSGTAMRLLSGLLAAQPFASQLIGDESLNTRPMSRIQQPLEQMGAHINMSPQGTAPLSISPCKNLKGIRYRCPIASAQIKSCLLLAGLYAQGTTTVIEPNLSRDHTERMLDTFSYPTTRTANSVSINGGGDLIATDIEVPGDISSAMFFIVAACIVDKSEVLLEKIGVNPTRTGALDILQRMGADIRIDKTSEVNGEPVADIYVRSQGLHGVAIDADEVPRAIDEFPILFIAAACAEGTTSLHGAAELRVKESDRIATMAEGLSRCGIPVTIYEDGITIEGGQIDGATIDASNDHRIAMAFAIAGAVAKSPIRIENCAAINTSFPDFCEQARQLGMNVAGDVS